MRAILAKLFGRPRRQAKPAAEVVELSLVQALDYSLSQGELPLDIQWGW